MIGPVPSLGQLRPALTLALETARSAGDRRLPGRVRSLVGARRLPANWAVIMAQVLEEDAGFRAWVASDASSETIGELPWLWLARPEGWSERAGELVEAAAETEEEEKAARLAQERTTALERELARARSELSEMQSRTAELESGAERHQRVVSGLHDRLRESAGRLRDATAEAEALTRRLAQLEDENAGLRRQTGDLQTELADLRRAVAQAESGAEEQRAARQRIDAAHRDLGAAVSDLRRELRESVGRAASAAASLGQALADAAAALDDGAAQPEPRAGSQPAPPALPPHPPPDARPAPSRPRSRPGGRRPLPLPPAVFEDSPEAAAHLVRAPGSHLVVDGYNVTFTSWTGTDLPALRHRLVAALSELAVRLQRTVTVVFDGTDDGGRVAPPPVSRPWLRIRFSDSSTEADEVIVDTVDGLGPDVPVVVATNDNQVRDDVRRRGANVLSVEQLLGVLGRQADRGRSG